MKTIENSGYVKRTQKDDSLSFKLEVVQEIEQGFLSRSQARDKYGIQSGSTITRWLKKYGNFTGNNNYPQRCLKLPNNVF